MPGLTRRTFTKRGLASLLTLLAPTSLYSCAAFRSRNKIPTAVFQDKLKGMILLGAYGDALGAFHEPRGLQGLIGNPLSVQRLPKASTYQPPGSQAAPWWVWVRGDELTEDIVGLPTDDSAFRLLILHPWLFSLHEEQPTEHSFVEWMHARMSKERTFEASQWQSRRQLQIQDWLIMFRDAKRWNESEGANPSSFILTEGNPFFRPEIPIVFGLFMYLEVAALYGEYPPQEVMEYFTSFSHLDQGYASSVTGLFAGLMAAAMSEPDTSLPFATWYASTITDLLKHAPPNADLLSQAFQTSWKIGTENQKMPESTFLDVVNKQIYTAPLPANRDSTGFRVFDPLLFFKQISASVAYSGSDIPKALSLLAVNPGDADTLPSMLGTLAGAWAGHNELEKISLDLRGDLLEVSKTLTSLFDYQVKDSSLKLALLAKRVRYS